MSRYSEGTPLGSKRVPVGARSRRKRASGRADRGSQFLEPENRSAKSPADDFGAAAQRLDLPGRGLADLVAVSPPRTRDWLIMGCST